MKRISSEPESKPDHDSKQRRDEPADSSKRNGNTTSSSTSSTNGLVDEASTSKPTTDQANESFVFQEESLVQVRTSSFSSANSSSSEVSSEAADDDAGTAASLLQLFNATYNDDENDPEWNGSSDEDDGMITSNTDSEELVDTTDEEMLPAPVLASFDTRGNTWEGPLKYKPLLTWLRVRKSILRNLRPLQLQCLQCVCDNINYFTSKNDPFVGLPASILQMLTKFLEKEDILINPQILPHVITSRSEYLPINLEKPPRFQGDTSTVFWTEDFTKLFSKMEQCKSSVQVLELRLNHPDFLAVAEDKFPTLDNINHSLSAMHNLQELQLNIVDASDETLAVIAVSCPQLRKLNLDGNLKISDKGIKSLCSENTSLCRNSIEYLSLNDTRVSTTGLMLALSSLPNLQYLHRDNHISVALRRYYASYGSSKPLKLASFKITAKFKKELVHYCKLLQNCKELDITLTPTFIAFSAFQNLVSLKYADNTLNTNLNSRFSYVTSLMFYKDKLTELHLQITNEVIDLSTIGNLCTNLEVFRFECQSLHHRIQRQATYIMDEKRHYTKLRLLHLQFSSRQNSHIPYEVLKVMLSSKCLQNITFIECRIPDAVLRPLTTEAMTNTDIFSSLEIITFRSCELLFRRIKNLICVAPNLKKICMARCNDPIDVWIDMKDSIGWFITQNRLKVELVFVAR